MIGKRAVVEKPVPLGQVLEILEKEKKSELDYAQRLAYDYAQKFAELDANKVKKMAEELHQIEKLREHQIATIIDTMPATKEDLEVIFLKERIALEEGDYKKILEIVEKYHK
jgi:DNA-directed RNA polymerase subunit F